MAAIDELSDRVNFFGLIVRERASQIERRGWTLEHDDGHSSNDWIALMTRYLGRMGEAAESGDPEAYEHRMVQAATILLAAYESLHRALADAEAIAAMERLGE